MKNSILFLFCLVTTSQAHVKLLNPTPRTQDIALTTSPCGNKAFGDPVRSIEVGTNFNVRWNMPLGHAGSFRVAYSPADDNSYDNYVLHSERTDGTTGNYQARVTAPNDPCSNCGVQILLDTDQGANYHSCSNVEFFTPDPCENVNCQNGGTCGGNGVCMCVNGFSGTNCEVPPDPCENVNCQNGGTCGGNGVCMCVNGFSGTNCEVPPDPCENVNCQNGGTCGGNGVCMCVDGFSGTNCEVPPDPCASIVCQNGGVCVNGLCDCPSGFSGILCQNVLDTGDSDGDGDGGGAANSDGSRSQMEMMMPYIIIGAAAVGLAGVSAFFLKTRKPKEEEVEEENKRRRTHARMNPPRF